VVEGLELGELVGVQEAARNERNLRACLRRGLPSFKAQKGLDLQEERWLGNRRSAACHAAAQGTLGSAGALSFLRPWGYGSACAADNSVAFEAAYFGGGHSEQLGEYGFGVLAELRCAADGGPGDG
jgi:hypothetical protein